MPRPNAARSGGPKTAVGRSRTANNAIKTGAYAVQVVLPGEDTQQFDALEAQLVQDFAPVGMAEAAMVHDLAVLTWKKLRVDRIEHAVMMQLVMLPMPEDRLQQSFGPGWLSAAMPRLVPFTPVSQAEFNEQTALVEQARALQGALPAQPTAATVQRKWPQLCAALQRWAEDYSVDADQLIMGVAEGVELNAALRDMITQSQTVLWLWEQREALAAALRRAQDSRLLEHMKGNNNVTQRAFDDIGRTFYRTLAELRRQQDWRLRRNAISVEDVSPKPPAS